MWYLLLSLGHSNFVLNRLFFFSPIFHKEMEKKMLHSERAVICVRLHSFVLSLVRGLEQNPCLHLKPLAFPLPL